VLVEGTKHLYKLLLNSLFMFSYYFASIKTMELTKVLYYHKNCLCKEHRYSWIHYMDC